MKKPGILFGIIVTGITLTSCSNFLHRQQAARLPSRQQLCTHLRQQMVFQANPNNLNLRGPNMTENTPINKARITNEYQRYNCDQFEPTIEDSLAQ